jgi:biopolymer transport protein ExbB/TolQ
VRKISRMLFAIAQSSLLWGCLAAVGFYALIFNDIIPLSAELRRYTSREWAEMVETTFFFVGAAELLLKGFDVAEQRSRLHKAWLLGGPASRTLQPPEARGLLDQLAALPAREQQGYYPRRLREILEIIWRTSSADELEDELKHLAASDATRLHDSYAFSRIVIWAIPIWGFLGTVLGITDAIASLNPSSMEGTLTQVTASLGGVFDTTALALGLSIALMFCQYFIDRTENGLLAEVDERTILEMHGRFAQRLVHNDPHVAVVEQMARSVIASAEQLVERQAEVWQRTIDAAHRRWSELTTTGQQHLETALGKALSRSLQAHAEQLTASEAAAADRNRRHWNRVHKGLIATSQASEAQHLELAKQTEVLLQVVQATGQVTKLENTLNENLSALAGAQHLQETLLGLAATIQLLNARLVQLAPMAPHVEIKDHSVGRAA